MLVLLFLAIAKGALQTDFANFYFCPKGYCLDKREHERGFVGPGSMFVRCVKGEDEKNVEVWNYYRANRMEIDYKDLWQMVTDYEKDVPDMLESKAVQPPCCEGAQYKQCELTENYTGGMGCCYRFGFGAMMKVVAQKPHEVMEEGNMLSSKKCPTDEVLMGGGVAFEKGVTCEEFESKAWVSENDKFNTMDDYKKHVKLLRQDECKMPLGRWNERKSFCKAKKPRCKKLNMEMCMKVRCKVNAKKKKCGGKHGLN